MNLKIKDKHNDNGVIIEITITKEEIDHDI